MAVLYFAPSAGATHGAVSPSQRLRSEGAALTTPATMLAEKAAPVNQSGSVT